MSFSYFDDNNKFNKLNIDEIQVGQKWCDIKTNNEHLNSIFASQKVDVNQDGIIDKNEIGILKALLKLADGITQKPNDNSVKDDILQNDELIELNKQLNNEEGKIIEVKNGNSPQLPEDYSYIEIYKANDNNYSAFSRKVQISNFDPSKLEEGCYYLEPDDFDKGAFSTVKPLKIQDTSPGNITNWSEGLNREIRTIRLADSDSENLKIVINEMLNIGKEVGFDVQLVNSNTVWIEDTHIRRHDGKVYIPNNTVDFTRDVSKNNFTQEVISRRSIVNTNAQGSVAQKKSGTEYAKTVPDADKIYGKSYLEGGNVLNTLLADGTPAAIIGEESIEYTLKVLQLDKTEENINLVKEKIAKDLNLKPENITFIPQFDYHIDIGYRQFNNGEISIPDYNSGIEFLQNTNIEGLSSNAKETLINELKRIQQEIGSIIDESEAALTKAGYKVLKIPCFDSRESNIPKINYMNGVAGTSSEQGSLPKGTTYYITNKSDYPEIDNFIENYLKENLGINKTYFVSTSSFLNLAGGIDCLTEEFGE